MTIPAVAVATGDTGTATVTAELVGTGEVEAGTDTLDFGGRLLR